MQDTEARLALPGGDISVALGRVWSLLPLPPEAAVVHGSGEFFEALGAHLLHAPTGIRLNVRSLRLPWSLADVTFEETFERYAGGEWPGTRTVSFWANGSLRGATAAFEQAMPGAIVREWLVTDGARFANAATFASAEQWKDLLEDCETLVRSIRFADVMR